MCFDRPLSLAPRCNWLPGTAAWLPALTTGPQLSAVATLSASNGFEKAVKGKVNVALVVLGPGTNYQGSSC